MKRHYKTTYTVTVKCDCCMGTSRYYHAEDVTELYDTVSQMVVCDGCRKEFEMGAKYCGDTLNWEYPPDHRIDYIEDEPDYDED